MDATFAGSVEQPSYSSDDSEIESVNSSISLEETADLNAAKQALSSLPLENFENLDIISESVTDDSAHLEGCKVSFNKAGYTRTESIRRSELSDSQQLNGNIQHETKKNDPCSTAESPKVNQGEISDKTQLTWELVNQLQSEVDQLRLSLKELPSPKVTIQKIIMGDEYSLEKYRSKEEKLQLLDEAIAAHDGNAIMAAVLFLRSSTEFTIFNRELVLRPAAVEHFICFLRQHRLHDDLVRFLMRLGRTEEAAMLSYSLAVSSAKSKQEKLSKIQNCYKNFFQSDAALVTESALINDQINLLPSQLQIEEYDRANAGRVFYLLPCKASVVGTSVITSLYYLCLYHYMSLENSLDSPLFLTKTHKLSEKQYQWTALRARSQLRNWKDVEKLFETKAFFGGTKMKAVIGFDRVVAFVSQMKAPREVLNRYCSFIDGTDTRLEVALRFRCHKTVVDTYVQLKDRLQLVKYLATLSRGSQDWTYANDILNTSNIKWKN